MPSTWENDNIDEVKQRLGDFEQCERAFMSTSTNPEVAIDYSGGVDTPAALFIMRGKAARVDYGGCDVGLGTPRGPPRLDALKTLVPCAAANCTKMAADDYACGHLLKLRARICKEVEAATDGNFAAEYFVPGYERLGTNGVSPF